MSVNFSKNVYHSILIVSFVHFTNLSAHQAIKLQSAVVYSWDNSAVLCSHTHAIMVLCCVGIIVLCSAGYAMPSSAYNLSLYLVLI